MSVPTSAPPHPGQSLAQPPTAHRSSRRPTASPERRLTGEALVFRAAEPALPLFTVARAVGMRLIIFCSPGSPFRHPGTRLPDADGAS